MIVYSRPSIFGDAGCPKPRLKGRRGCFSTVKSTPGHHAHEKAWWPIFRGRPMKFLSPFLNKLDREKLKEILSMEKTPTDQARHIVEQYKNDAWTVVQDLIDIFVEADDKDSEQYWRTVRENLSNNQTRH